MQVSSVQPVFKLELNHRVIPNTVIIAKYDGIHPCLTAAAGYDKIIIHHPHGTTETTRAHRSTAHGEVSELALSQKVVALAAGMLKPDIQRDMLLVGSPNQILAYDFHENSDLFYKEALDGVNVIVVGSYSQWSDNVVLVGGNSSLQVLDWRGDELAWTVTSKICAMVLLDYDKDGENEEEILWVRDTDMLKAHLHYHQKVTENVVHWCFPMRTFIERLRNALIIGCEDSYIRVVKQGQVIQELPETGAVAQLTVAGDTKFGYALANGTVGIYDEGVRIWRVKSKQKAVSVWWCGAALAACWAGGRVDWREGASGRALRRVQTRGAAAGMLVADYRSLGAPDLVCVSETGEVVGYPLHVENTGLPFHTTKTLPSEQDRQAITELFNKKQALLLELQHYEASSNIANVASVERSSSTMPANTRLQVAVACLIEEGCIELAIATNNDTVVRSVVVLAEGVFPGETAARHPPKDKLRPHLFMQLRPPRDVPIDVHVKALVGYPDSEQFHIFELSKQLPRFAMYTLATELACKSEKEGQVTFKITERIQRICIWLNQNFLLEKEIEPENDDAKELHVNLISLRDKSKLAMDFETDGTVRISTHAIKLAGDLVQSLALYLNVTDLQTAASFPVAEGELRAEAARAWGLCETRARLHAEAAERAQLIAALLPAAQDTGAHDMKEMLNRYKEVVMLNEEILAGCHVRRATHQQAVEALRSLHTVLQHAARLRVGKYSKAVVAASRRAVKDNDVEALIKILQIGDA